MVSARAAAAESISFDLYPLSDDQSEFWRRRGESSQKHASVGAENFPIQPQHVLDFCGRLRWGAPIIRATAQHPSLDFILADESKLLVQRSALRRSIEFHSRNASQIEVLNGSLAQRGASTLPAILWVNNDHADPCKPAFVSDGCRGADDPAV